MVKNVVQLRLLIIGVSNEFLWAENWRTVGLLS